MRRPAPLQYQGGAGSARERKPMSSGTLPDVLGYLRRLAGDGPVASLPDGELLRRFASGRDESAFEVLVRRHGPTVLRVCRQMLRDPHDAEDAFQATFLVLVKRADSVGRGERLANWLYGVALRVAARARVRAARRRAVEG